MIAKKAIITSVVVAAVTILVMASIPIAAKEKEPGFWEMMVPGHPDVARGQFLMFGDFEASKMHFSLPAVGPSGGAAMMSADVDNVKTNGDFQNNLHLEAEKLRLLLTPISEPPFPMSAEVLADLVTVDIHLDDQPDPETGVFGELTAVLKKNVVFNVVLNPPAPPWWVTPPLYSDSKFTIHLIFVLPDYEVTIDPPEVEMYPSWYGTPTEDHVTVTVTPTTEVSEPVGLHVEHPGQMKIIYDETHKTPTKETPATWDLTIQNHAGDIPPEPHEVKVRLTGPNLPADQCETIFLVRVIPRFNVAVEPTDILVEKSQYEGDWKYAAAVTVTTEMAQYGPARFYWDGGPGIGGQLRHPNGTIINWEDPLVLPLVAELWIDTHKFEPDPVPHHAAISFVDDMYGEGHSFHLLITVQEPQP